jgi:pSer/pThr/pTyr-binding forkhead associated (FHA) protein
MPDDHPQPPEVETQQVIRWITDPTTLQPPAVPLDPLERPIRPVLRPPVPILTVLDDGTFTNGEHFRLRGDTFSIGRTDGNLVIPCDRTLSGSHAEIRRVEHRGQVEWLLVDRDTANGTFVRINSANFFVDTIVILGSRRFRLVLPFAEFRSQTDESTQLLEKAAAPADLWPTLTEAGTSNNALKFPLRQQRVTIGRIGGGCDISIDDPHLASHHATIARETNGAWRIRPEKTSNGVWINVRSVKLTPHCYFRCGEQFFRFVIP